MSRRTLVLLAASVIAGMTLAASVATDASAARKQQRAVAARPAMAAVVVVTDYGPPADRVPRCFDSPILYPVPPCY